jgi:hypothetical protein
MFRFCLARLSKNSGTGVFSLAAAVFSGLFSADTRVSIRE